jgi:hypothetical protein
MSFVPGKLQRLLIASLLSSLPVAVVAQQQQINLTPAPATNRPALEPVPVWGKRLIESINNVWTEGSPTRREVRLSALVEGTPAQLAYITRVFQQNDPVKTGQTIYAMREVFSLIHRVSWQPGDMPAMQRVVASWSVVTPQLVKMIGVPELSANQRRILEQALVDLAHVTRDAKLGTPHAKETWQKETATLAALLKHPKTSVRLTVLSIIEALGTDAQPITASVQQTLSDTDRFVRWSAVRTLTAIGLDANASKAVAKLKNDEDSLVREAVLVALQPAAPAVLAKEEPKPVPNASLANVPPLNVNVPISTAPPERPAATLPKLTETKVTPPSKPVELPTMTSKREVPAATSKPSPAQPAVLPNGIPALPVEGSPVLLPVLPALPAVKEPAVSEPQPLFGPPISKNTEPVVKPKTPTVIQPVAAATPPPVPKRVEPKPTGASSLNLWLPRVKQGTVEQQVQAVREIGKFGAGAADAVPTLAEVLINGNIAVRREVPDTLVKIGTSAKMATAVLERCLQDADTELKVNAARALLELSDK